MYQVTVDEGIIDAVKETIADVLSVSPSSERIAELKMSVIVSFTASITLINTQLIHQFVFRRADAVT